MLQALAEKSITTEASLELMEITDKGVIVKDKMGDMKEMSCDTVVLAVGLKADDVLYQELAEEYDEIYKIGDCIKARKFIDVTQEAYYVSMEI